MSRGVDLARAAAAEQPRRSFRACGQSRDDALQRDARATRRTRCARVGIARDQSSRSFAPRRARARRAADADAAENRGSPTSIAGVAAFCAGDFADALRRAVDGARPCARQGRIPIRWLALTEAQLGDCASALGHIEDSCRACRPAIERVAEMARWRDILQTHGREPKTPARPPTTAAPSGDALSLARDAIARTYKLVVDHPGYRSASQTDRPQTQVAYLYAELDPDARACARSPTGGGSGPRSASSRSGSTGGVVYAATRGDETVLPPIHCTNAGCMP